MTSRELTLKILSRIRKLKFLIIIGGLLIGALLFIYARSKTPIYSVRATVFPLTSSHESSSASSKISELLGGGAVPKNISDEANVNIEEVAKSRKTSEAVVSERLPGYQNKLVAELLIREYNKSRDFGVAEIKLPMRDSVMISVASGIMQNKYSVKFNKNSLLEVNFSSADKDLLIPVSYILIDKISGFYKELKIEKAKADFDFIQAKVDSFQQVLNVYDKKRIQMNNTTLFVPASKLQYTIPKENINNDKLRVMSQHSSAASEREDALWRLQKATPIIQILDKPEEPFAEIKPSAKLYAVGGFILGCILFALFSVTGILYRYINEQINNSLLPDKVAEENINTTA